MTWVGKWQYKAFFQDEIILKKIQIWQTNRSHVHLRIVYTFAHITQTMPQIMSFNYQHGKKMQNIAQRNTNKTKHRE